MGSGPIFFVVKGDFALSRENCLSFLADFRTGLGHEISQNPYVHCANRVEVAQLTFAERLAAPRDRSLIGLGHRGFAEGMPGFVWEFHR
jgi:hypothetical protein